MDFEECLTVSQLYGLSFSLPVISTIILELLSHKNDKELRHKNTEVNVAGKKSWVMYNYMCSLSIPTFIRSEFVIVSSLNMCNF